jgi:hypothetical protein
MTRRLTKKVWKRFYRAGGWPWLDFCEWFRRMSQRRLRKKGHWMIGL